MKLSIFEEEYLKACNQESDINEHLPVLRSLAKEVSHVTEMGVREGVSTRAFLCENVVLRCYDLYLSGEVNRLFDIAKEQRKNVNYIQTDVLNVEIEETDLLFIDTWHCYDQLVQELKIHSPKVKKYIAFHDTQTYGTRSETFQGKTGSNGLLPAIIEFVIENPEWKFKIHRTNNNGLTVIERT
jgi:hypothetical protein